MASLKKRKIAVLGPRSVGKSSLVHQFVENRFAELYHPTIESTFVKTITYNGIQYECELIDTAGQDEYSILGPKHTIGIHGFILVYSIASRKSFDMIQIVYDKIIDYCGVIDIPCVIVGSKADLENSRQVAASDGESLAQANKAAWVETSAKNNQNIVFELCLHQIEKRSSNGQSDTESKASRCFIM